jgi:GT2 family glycosyltransferase
VTARKERICAVVVTFNRKALLKECLTALLRQTRRLDEIIVMDNASTDGTEELVKAKFTDITYIRLPENIGGAGGFHEGMKLAYEKGYDWIWVMDDDAVPLPDALEQLITSPAILQPKVYGLACTVINPDDSICVFHRRMFDTRGVREKPADAIKYREPFFEIDTASFVGFLISRKAIDEVGLPLKDFFIFYDDTEYSLRIREKGFILNVSASKIMHVTGGQPLSRWALWRQPLGWRNYYLTRNQIYTYSKYGSSRLRFFPRLFVFCILMLGVLLVFRRSKLQGMRLLWSGVYDGLRGRLGKNKNFIPG